MLNFRVMIIKKNNKPIGVRAASFNGRTIILALHDDLKRMNWDDAVKKKIPSIGEWAAINENLETVNKALIRAGGEPLKEEWYWSSSECDDSNGWCYRFYDCNGSITDSKYTQLYVRQTLEEFK